MPANLTHNGQPSAQAEEALGALDAALDELLAGALDDARTQRALGWLASKLRSSRVLLGQLDDYGELMIVCELVADHGVVQEDAIAMGFPSEDWVGAWGAALTSGRTHVDNEPQSVGPERLRCSRALAAPISFDGAVIGLAFAADKPSEYTDADAQLITHFARRTAPVLAYTLTQARFTRQLYAAEEMAAAAAEGERFFMMSRDPMVITDASIRRANAAFTSLLGLSAQELRDRSLAELTHPKDRARLERELHLMRTEPNREHAPIAVEMVAKDGEQRRVEWVGAATHDGRVYAVGRDITVLSWAMEDLAITNGELQRLHEEAQAEEQLAARVIAHVRRQGSLDSPGFEYVASPLGFFSGDVPLASYLPNGELRWLLGDFTGHGLAAAIGTVPLAGSFHLACRRGVPFVEMLGTINDMLKAVLPPGLFCASAWFSLNPERTELSLWNCGLPPVMVRRGKTGAVEQYDSEGLPLGVLATAELGIAPIRIAVEKDDDVFVFSDGLTECTNTSGELFGVERLKATLETAQRSGQGFEALMREVASFRGAEQAKDDLSALCVSVGLTRATSPAEGSSSQGSMASAESSQR